MLRSLALVLSLAAAPALAQDGAAAAAQLVQAMEAFTLPGAPSMGREDLAGDAAIMAVLPSLEGTWVRADILFPDPANWKPDLFTSSCARVGIALEQTADRSFVLLHSSAEGASALPVRHDWIGSNGFARSVAEGDLVAHLGLEDEESIHRSFLVPPSHRAQVAMFHPSPDILVFAAAGEPPEILARCP